jgi:hypothetical protein
MPRWGRWWQSKQRVHVRAYSVTERWSFPEPAALKPPKSVFVPFGNRRRI